MNEKLFLRSASQDGPGSTITGESCSGGIEYDGCKTPLRRLRCRAGNDQAPWLAMIKRRKRRS
jgi:hypothetical protein